MAIRRIKTRSDKDAYGQEIFDYYKGKGGFEIIEREGGYFDVSSGPKVYFDEYRNWPAHQKEGIRYARGRVIDVGCGAGRVALYLQSKGTDVLGIDISPLALKVCRQRGVKKTKLMSITQLSKRIGLFDTIIMYGNNFGLFGSFKRARWLLRRLYNMTTDRGRIIAETVDVYDTKEPEHLAYHKLNRARGRMSGQLRLRVRYKKYVTDWFDYLLVSKSEIKQILAETGWKVKSFIDSKTSLYVAVIEKER